MCYICMFPYGLFIYFFIAVSFSPFFLYLIFFFLCLWINIKFFLFWLSVSCVFARFFFLRVANVSVYFSPLVFVFFYDTALLFLFLGW